MPYKELFTTVVLEKVLVAAATSCFRVSSSCHSCYGRIQLQTDEFNCKRYEKATNSIANGTNTIAKPTNSIANGTNSIAKATNSIANGTNSIAKSPNSIAKPVINCDLMHSYNFTRLVTYVFYNETTTLHCVTLRSLYYLPQLNHR